MNPLFDIEKIYDYPDAMQLDTSRMDKHLVVCRKEDLKNGGKEKLLEIVRAIQWDINTNLELVDLEEKESIQLSSGLPLKRNKRIVLSFGLKPMDLCLQCPLQFYQRITFENAIVIFSHSVQELIDSKQYKSNLWGAIKSFKS